MPSEAAIRAAKAICEYISAYRHPLMESDIAKIVDAELKRQREELQG